MYMCVHIHTHTTVLTQKKSFVNWMKDSMFVHISDHPKCLRPYFHPLLTSTSRPDKWVSWVPLGWKAKRTVPCTNAQMHKCFKFPVWVDRLSFVLLVPLHLGTYLCTCAHLDTNTHRQAHKRLGDGEFWEAFYTYTTDTQSHISFNICCG